MPDVGVLNLQIHDDSAKAAEGLNRLATSLNRVKAAVGNGLKLSGIANQLKKINEAVSTAIPEENIARLERLAKAVSELNSAGGIKLNGMKDVLDLKNMSEGISKARDGIEQGLGSAFETVKQRIVDVDDGMGKANQLVQNMAWTAGDMAEKFAAALQALLAMKSARALGSGEDTGNTSETGWTLWKDGAIEAEYTISDAVDSITHRIDGVNQLLLESGNESKDASENYRESFEEIREEARQTSDALEDAFGHKRVWDRDTGEWKSLPYSQEEWESRLEELSHMMDQPLPQGPEQLPEEFDRASQSADGLIDRIRQLAQSLRETAGNGLTNLREGFQRMAAPISNVANQFARIVRYRMFRAVLKQITGAVKEGAENYYRYSQAIKSSFAPSMDSAATSLQQMKNTIGAALAPAIQQLIPILQSVVSWFVTLINYANQFMALLRGQATWSRATNKSAKAFDDVKKSAGGASSAIKDLLADWDELNIIQSEGGGGGGGGTKAMTDYLGMFEEVNKFDNKIKATADYLKNHFKDIQSLIAMIGAGILGWRISNAFSGVLATLGTVAQVGAVMAVTWKLTEMFDDDYARTGEKGWLIADALTNAVGATLAGSIVGNVLGGAAGVVTAGIELTVSAGITYATSLLQEDQDRASALATLSAIKLAIGAVAMGLGFGIASGSAALGFVSAAIAPVLFALTAAVTVVVKQVGSAKEIAKKAFAKTGEGGISVDEIFKAVQDELTEATKGYSLIIDAFSSVPELQEDLSGALNSVESLTAVVTGGGKLTKEEAEEFKANWQTVFSAFEEITKSSFDTAFEGLNQALASENAEIRNQAKELRISLLMLQNNYSEAEARIHENVTNLADKISSGKYSQEDLDAYLKYVEAMAKADNKATSELEDIVKSGENIDFGTEDTAFDNVLAYFSNVKSAAEAATSEIEEGYKAELDALNELRKRNEIYHILGEIDNDEYANANALFDDLEKTFTSTADERKSSIEKTVQTAYQQVLDQALDGLEFFRNPGSTPDALAAYEYMRGYVTEIAAAILQSGGTIDDELAKALGIGVNIFDAESAMIEYLRNYFSVDNPAKIEETAEEAVSDALSGVDVPAVDMQVPLDIELEPNYVESETSLGTGIDIEAEKAQMTVLGIPTEGGWLNNFWKNLTQIDPAQLDMDMNVHVHYDEDDSDLHIEDLVEDWQLKKKNGKLWTTDQVTGKAGASSGVRYAGGSADESMEIVVKQDNSEQQGNITAGVSKATGDISSTLSSILNVANAINRKNFTVNITPSTMFGRVSSKSQQYTRLVTGETNP